MNREEGWFKLFRSMFNNPVVMKDADHLALWVYLLGQASHKPHDTVFGGKRITLQPGQLITGRNKLASVLKIDPSKVKRILKEFKSEHQIDQQSERYGSLISIVNWSQYQQDDQRSDQRVTNERPTSDQRVTTIQECKNDKNGKNERNNTPKPPEGACVDRAKMEVIREVVDHLNVRTGKHYLPTTRLTQKKIIARINEGFTTEDFIRVIDIKAMEWMNTDREKYLRPETLFGTKFEGYLNQRPERRKMNPIEIARAMDEAERRKGYDEGTGWSDVRQSLGGIPEQLSWDE